MLHFALWMAAATMPGDTAIEDPWSKLSWRNIGPANMSGRVADVEGVRGHPELLYVGM